MTGAWEGAAWAVAQKLPPAIITALVSAVTASVHRFPKTLDTNMKLLSSN